MAQNYGVQLSIDVAHLVRQINAAIRTINADGKINPLKLSASTSALSASIRKAISEINSGEKLKSRPVNIDASESKLRQSIATAIKNINSSGALNGKAVNLKANLRLDDAVKKVRSQIADITAKSGDINVGGSATNAAIANVRKQLQAEGEQLKTNNGFLRERITLFTRSGDIATSRKYGTLGENTVVNAANGTVTSITQTTDNSRIAAEQAKVTSAINGTRNAAIKLRDSYADINSTKPISNTAYFNDLENRYNEIIRLTNEFSKSDTQNAAQFKADMQAKIDELDRFVKLYQKAEYAPSTLRAKDIGTLKSISTNQLDEFVSKIKASNVPINQMQGTIDNLKLSLSNISDAGSLTKFLNEFSIAQSEFSALKSESKALATEMSRVDAVAKQITSSIKTLENKGNQGIFLKNSGNENVAVMQKVFADLTAKYTALQTSLKNDPSAENLAVINKELSTLQKQLQKALTDSEALKKSLKAIKMSEDLTKKANTLLGQITQYERANGKALDTVNPISGITFGAELEQIKAAIPNVRDLGTIDQLNNRFVTLRANVKALGKEGNTTFTEMRNSAAKFIKWMGMTLLLTKVRMYFNQLFTTVLDLDTALIDLKKTFNGTAEELNDFYFEANRLAKQMGVTTAEIIKQGAAFSRLGYSSNETMKKMAEMSAMFAAISPDMDTEQAQDGLVSIMKAFDIDPDNVLDGILSKVNIIGNTAATSNGEIVEMLKRSSAAMRESNNTLEETIALETAAIEVTRDAPGTGVAWKTISARLRGLDEETLQVSDDITELTGKFADFTKTAKTPGGISLFTDESKTTYKSTYQIIKELSEIWDDLTDVQTARIGEVIGGKRQLQVVSAAIENFEAAEKALDNMSNSAGSAEAEMDTIRQSAAYALNELKETFTSLAQNSVGRGELKALINTGTALLELLNGLVKTFGGLPVVIGAASAAITVFKKKGEGLLGYNSKGNFTFWGAETKNGFKAWYNEKTDPTGQKAAQKAQINNQVAAVKEFDSAIKTNSMNLRTYNAVMQSSNDNVKRYGRAVMQGTDNAKAFNTVNKQLKKELKQVGKNAKVAADGTKQLTAGMKALNIAGSMLVSMGISWAISKVIELISTSVNWADTYSQKADDAADKTKSITSQIESVNEELADTKLKIDKLNKLENPTIIQQEELDKLIETNNELERLQKSLQAQQKDAANEAANATVEWWKTINYSGIGEGYKDPGDWLIHWVPRTYGGMTTEINKESYGAFIDAIAEYKNLQDEIAKTQKEMSETADESYYNKLDEQLGKLKDKLKDVESIAEHNYSIWTAKIGTLNLDIPEQKEIYDKMNELIYYWEYFSGKVKKELKDIVDDHNYAVVKQHLIDLWKQGKLTEEEFSKITDETVSGFEAFKQALADNGYTDFAEILRAVITYFEDTAENADNAAKAVKTFADMLEAVQEKIDGFLSKQEKLVEAFKKIELGGKLTANEVYELVKEMPELAKYLTEAADGWEISSKNFDKASRENIEAEKQELQSRIDTIRSYLETLGMAKTLGNQVKYSKEDPLIQAEYENALKKAQGLYGVLDISSDDGIDTAFDDLSEELNGLLFLMDLVDKAFNTHEESVNGLKERYEEIKSEISDYNKQIQSIDSAIKTLNGDTLLSYDELNELLEIDPDLKYDKEENGYSISIDALEELREKSYETRNARIADIKAVVQAEIEAANTTKAEYQKEIEEIGKMGVTAMALEALGEVTKNLDGVNVQLDYLYDLLKKLDGLEQDITYNAEADKSLSDKLQNEIDYYKNILEAVQIVRDKYSEAIDKEIDALQDSKDALKDANDERQREIDLRETAIDLENAKKRKAYVYTEGDGFKQVRDEKAVKEAEEKYRDAVTAVQEAEIDKEIKLREDQKEALEENTKALTELEQNIQNALTVEQAKADLDLSDEKELLNLPADVQESIKNGLADAMTQKNNKENEGTKHKSVTFEDVLKSVGAKVSADALESVKSDLVTATQYKAQNSLANSLKQATDAAVTNIVNNNGNTINNPIFNINGVNDPNQITKAIHDYLWETFAGLGNSVK